MTLTAGVLHEEVVDQHGARQGRQRRRHLSLPPRAAKTPQRFTVYLSIR
jgi:hypothetical protein